MDENEYIPFGASLFVFNKNLHKYLDNKFKKFNLNVYQGLFLIKIYNTPNTTQQELANSFFLTKGNVAKLLRYLEDESFIKRIRPLDDKRKYKIELTEKSIEIIPTLKKLGIEIDKELGLDEVDSEFFKIFDELSKRCINLNK